MNNSNDISTSKSAGHDNIGSLASESLFSTVPASEPRLVTESDPILAYQDDNNYMGSNNGYLRFDNCNSNSCNNQPLKYPSKIDPYRTICQIICVVLVALFLILLVGATFLKNLGRFHNSPYVYSEAFICFLVFLSCAALLFFFIHSRSWSSFLFNVGFYTFPQLIIRRRIVVIFIWCSGIFLFSPTLLVLRVICDNSTVNYEDEKACLWVLSSYNLLQIYIGIQSLLVLVTLIHYLITIIRFRVRRQWPDIWHERLLEESALIENCPLIKICELRIDDNENRFTVRTNPDNIPTDKEIMKSQAYVIKYLRNLNEHLASKIYELNKTDNLIFTNYGSFDCIDSRERHIEQPTFAPLPIPCRDNDENC